MTELPLECFWTLGKSGNCKSYYNSRAGMYEDFVKIMDGVSHYELLGNTIATYDGRILSLHHANWHTALTRDRLFAIVMYGEKELGLKIPIEPRLSGTIYWVTGDKAVVPKSYPLRVDVITGEILSPLIEVIPVFLIPPSKSKKSNAVIRLRKLPGVYIIRNDVVYLKLFGRMYKLDGGLWVEVTQ